MKNVSNMSAINIGQENINILKMIPNMEERAKMVSTESFDVYIKNVAGFFKNKLSDMSSVFSQNGKRANVITNVSYSEYIVTLSKLTNEINKIVNTKKYENIQHIVVPTTLGIRTNLIDTVELLTGAMKIVNTELYHRLNETDTFVAKVISDDNFKSSTKPFKPSVTKDNLKLLEEALHRLIDPNSYNDTKKINELLPNLSSLVTVHKDLLDISRGSSLKDMENIKKIIATISSRVTLLKEHLHDNQTTGKAISKVVLNELAVQLDDSAKLVTISISIIHILNQTAITIKSIVDKIK